MRCCALLRGMSLLEDASLDVPAGILYRQHWETWLVSLYVLLRGKEALPEIEADHVMYTRILGKKFGLGPEHLPDPEEEARKLKIHDLAKKIGPLLVEAGVDEAADLGVMGYDGVYRIQSNYAVHAGLSTIILHLRIRDGLCSVEPNPPAPFDDNSQFAAFYTLHLAKYVFERFGIATGTVEAAIDELHEHITSKGASSRPEERDMSPPSSRLPSSSTLNPHVPRLVDEFVRGAGRDRSLRCDRRPDHVVEPAERKCQQEGESGSVRHAGSPVQGEGS